MNGPHPISTVAALARVLRERVLHGQYPEGSPLRETEIAGEFGVSRNTVREALRLLVMERVLVHQPHRSVAVPRFDEVAISDMLRFRLVLELEAVRTICMGDGPPVLSLPKTGTESAAGAHEAVLAWHATMVQAVDSDRVVTAHRHVTDELRVVLAAIDGDAPLVAPAPRDALADALGRQDHGAAVVELEELLAGDERQLVEARQVLAEGS